MAASNDAGIVAALHSDRVVGFNQLYSAYADTIYRYASSLKVDTATARRITSDTLLAAVGNVGRLRNPDDLSSWLLAIAANEAVKQHAVSGGGAGMPLPADLHGDVAARLGVMLRSGVLPDIGAVDAKGFPEAVELAPDAFGPDTVPTSTVDAGPSPDQDEDATALLDSATELSITGTSQSAVGTIPPQLQSCPSPGGRTPTVSLASVPRPASMRSWSTTLIWHWQCLPTVLDHPQEKRNLAPWRKSSG